MDSRLQLQYTLQTVLSNTVLILRMVMESLAAGDRCGVWILLLIDWLTSRFHATSTPCCYASTSQCTIGGSWLLAAPVPNPAVACGNASGLLQNN
jgi:hypothetical protein